MVAKKEVEKKLPELHDALEENSESIFNLAP
jgi:hypothetical protein